MKAYASKMKRLEDIKRKSSDLANFRSVANLECVNRQLVAANELMLKEIINQSRNYQEGTGTNTALKKPAPLASADFALRQSFVNKQRSASQT